MMEATIRLAGVGRAEERNREAARRHPLLDRLRAGLPGFVFGTGTLVALIVMAYLVSR